MLDISNDFDVFDNTEVVTYRSKGDGDTFEDTPNVPALRVTVGISPPLSPARLTFHAKAAAIPATVYPKPTDRIKDATGAEWAVESVSLLAWGTRYEFECVRVR